MNTLRKVLLPMLVIAAASLGLAGCKQKSDHPTNPEHPTEKAVPAEHPAGEHPTTDALATCPKCGEAVGSEACCMQKAAKDAVKETEEVAEEAEAAVKKAAAEHPTEHPTEHPK